jgi:hypothetical protein
MTSSVEQLLREAERLTPDEREELALCLLDTLEPDPVTTKPGIASSKSASERLKMGP